MKDVKAVIFALTIGSTVVVTVKVAVELPLMAVVLCGEWKGVCGNRYGLLGRGCCYDCYNRHSALHVHFFATTVTHKYTRQCVDVKYSCSIGNCPLP